MGHHSSSQGENAEDDNCQPASFHRKADWSKAVGGNQQPPFLHRNVNRSFNLTSSRIWDPATVLLHNDQQSEFLLCTCRHFTQLWELLLWELWSAMVGYVYDWVVRTGWEIFVQVIPRLVLISSQNLNTPKHDLSWRKNTHRISQPAIYLPICQICRVTFQESFEGLGAWGQLHISIAWIGHRQHVN